MPLENPSLEKEAVPESGRRLRCVSLVTNLYIAGDANRLLAYARGIDANKFDHRLLLIVRPDDPSLGQHGPMVEKFEAHGIRIDHLGEPSRRMRKRGRGRLRTIYDDLVTFSRVLKQLRDYFAENQIDVVDARMNYAILLGALAGKWARVPAIVATEYGYEFWRPPFRWLAGQIAFKMIDALISDSKFRIDAYKKWLWFGHKRAVVIENGIFKPVSTRTSAEMRAEFDLPADPKIRIIGQVSRLVPYKGHRVLVAAAAKVLAENPDVAFLFCGYAHVPNYVEELREQARALGIGDRLRIVSYPGLIADVWQAIDLHVHASLYDSSPIAIHESMALGIPAVVTRTGGIPDLVVADKTGLVVEADNPDALAAGILKLLGDDRLATQLGQAAQQRFENDYQVTVMNERIHELFESILASKRPKWRASPT